MKNENMVSIKTGVKLSIIDGGSCIGVFLLPVILWTAFFTELIALRLRKSPAIERPIRLP